MAAALIELNITADYRQHASVETRLKRAREITAFANADGQSLWWSTPRETHPLGVNDHMVQSLAQIKRIRQDAQGEVELVAGDLPEIASERSQRVETKQ